MVDQLTTFEETVSKAGHRSLINLENRQSVVREVVSDNETTICESYMNLLTSVRNKLGKHLEVQIAIVHPADDVFLWRDWMNAHARPQRILIITDGMQVVMEELRGVKTSDLLHSAKIVDLRRSRTAILITKRHTNNRFRAEAEFLDQILAGEVITIIDEHVSIVDLHELADMEITSLEESLGLIGVLLELSKLVEVRNLLAAHKLWEGVASAVLR